MVVAPSLLLREGSGVFAAKGFEQNERIFSARGQWTLVAPAANVYGLTFRETLVSQSAKPVDVFLVGA